MARRWPERRSARPRAPGLSSPAPVGYRRARMAFEYKPGIYKTTKFLPGHEAEVAPNLLVLIRTDAEFAPASVLLPVSNTNNQWRFQMPGVRIPANSLNWGTTLIKLPHEGFYRLKEQLTFGDSGRWLVNAIVQLGWSTRSCSSATPRAAIRSCSSRSAATRWPATTCSSRTRASRSSSIASTR